MKTVCFQADGGSQIGFGHLIRCLSLARMFQNKGWTVTFISFLAEGITIIRKNGFSVQSEIILEEFLPDVLIVDSYQVTAEYFSGIRPFCKILAYVDDLNRESYPVDVLINGNVSAPFLGYKSGPEKTVMLLGAEFNMIREEFREIPARAIVEKADTILITTGGSDPLHHCLRMAEAILKDQRSGALRIHIIVGPAFQTTLELKCLAMKHTNVILHQNTDRMSQLMQQMDVAISAGGSTLYELCACGVPTLAYSMVENQREVVRTLNEMGCVMDFGGFDPVSPEPLLTALAALIADKQQRENLANNGKRVVDGLGVERIFNRICQLV